MNFSAAAGKELHPTEKPKVPVVRKKSMNVQPKPIKRAVPVVRETPIRKVTAVIEKKADSPDDEDSSSSSSSSDSSSSSSSSESEDENPEVFNFGKLYIFWVMKFKMMPIVCQ